MKLIEAFCWELGVKWGKSMRQEVREGKLHCGQFGGLPGRDCKSHKFIEEIRFDHSILMIFPFANFANDATA